MQNEKKITPEVMKLQRKTNEKLQFSHLMKLGSVAQFITPIHKDRRISSPPPIL